MVAPPGPICVYFDYICWELGMCYICRVRFVCSVYGSSIIALPGTVVHRAPDEMLSWHCYQSPYACPSPVPDVQEGACVVVAGLTPSHSLPLSCTSVPAVHQTGESARSEQRRPAKWRKSNTERQYTGRHEREAASYFLCYVLQQWPPPCFLLYHFSVTDLPLLLPKGANKAETPNML
ncbi:hypothetical protein JOQ06_001608 [Pogonophryne albipinna]|uniref:Uncharacterized protein n=1 Tax=Pogonophryne albipinna TaxID=1090488 RepID=A0AAD6B693_9TELE|nr:hypothetical protein JOQ06_001608 [Pogonophryne albipinna]